MTTNDRQHSGWTLFFGVITSVAFGAALVLAWQTTRALQSPRQPVRDSSFSLNGPVLRRDVDLLTRDSAVQVGDAEGIRNSCNLSGVACRSATFPKSRFRTPDRRRAVNRPSQVTPARLRRDEAGRGPQG